MGPERRPFQAEPLIPVFKVKPLLEKGMGRRGRDLWEEGKGLVDGGSVQKRASCLPA